MNRSRWWWRRKELNCHRVGQLLQSYLDTELTDDDRARVFAHLDACKDCGLEAETYERIKVALAQPLGGEVDSAALDRLRDFGEELTESD